MKAPWFVSLLFIFIPSLAFTDNRPIGRSFVTRSEVMTQSLATRAKRSAS